MRAVNALFTFGNLRRAVSRNPLEFLIFLLRSIFRVDFIKVIALVSKMHRRFLQLSTVLLERRGVGGPARG